MLVIPVPIDNELMDLWVILRAGTIRRITRYDPVHIAHARMSETFTDARPIRDVIITYATPDDLAVITPLLAAGDLPEALQYLSRGFQNRPDKGDDDKPYESILPRFLN